MGKLDYGCSICTRKTLSEVPFSVLINLLFVINFNYKMNFLYYEQTIKFTLLILLDFLMIFFATLMRKLTVKLILISMKYTMLITA
jgi:hypothetical protein